MHELIQRKVDWEKDRSALIQLFKTTWKEDPVTEQPFYNWQLVECVHGQAIGYCILPSDQPDFIVGIYLVLPSRLLVGASFYYFSVSMYTITHPSYYGRGIFKRLATHTYEECLKQGIVGTVGVPNKKSLHGFTASLNFKAIGQLEIFCKSVSAPRLKQSVLIREVKSENELRNLKFSLIGNKAKDGTLLLERNPGFLSWRFFSNPKTRYTVFVSVKNDNELTGILVLRKAVRKHIPITVAVEFLVDHTLSEANEIACALLSQANRFALRSLTPLIIVLLNPFSYEAKMSSSCGFRQIPKKILPHDSNFILRIHADIADELKKKLEDFKSWHFSFADYDLF